MTTRVLATDAPSANNARSTPSDDESSPAVPSSTNGSPAVAWKFGGVGRVSVTAGGALVAMNSASGGLSATRPARSVPSMRKIADEPARAAGGVQLSSHSGTSTGSSERPSLRGARRVSRRANCAVPTGAPSMVKRTAWKSSGERVNGSAFQLPLVMRKVNGAPAGTTRPVDGCSTTMGVPLTAAPLLVTGIRSVGAVTR